ncbi:MAG: VWA domain-containing protein [Chloroflexi bacterium]|nr:VWA domain-containing protein [Chloroflexota bacterium]
MYSDRLLRRLRLALLAVFMIFLASSTAAQLQTISLPETYEVVDEWDTNIILCRLVNTTALATGLDGNLYQAVMCVDGGSTNYGKSLILVWSVDPRRRMRDLDPGEQVNALAAGQDGSVYFEQNGKLVRYDRDGTRLWEATNYTRPLNIEALAVTPGRDVYALNQNDHKIIHFLPGGQYAGDFDPAAASGQPNLVFDTLAVSSSGNLVATSSQSTKIWEFNPDGSLRSSQTITTGTFPRLLALDTGDQRFLYTSGGHMEKYSATGDLLAFWGQFGNNRGQYQSPHDLVVDSLDHVVLSDNDRHALIFYARSSSTPTPIVPSATPTPPPPTATPVPVQTHIRCDPQGLKFASPTSLMLGGTVTVTLGYDARCTGGATSADVMLLIDHSGSMGGVPLQDAKNGALGFISLLDPAYHQVSVIAFDDVADVLQTLTADYNAARQAIMGINVGGGTEIAVALEQGIYEFQTRGRQGARWTMILLSDGESPAPPAIAAADTAKAMGIRIFTIGLGRANGTLLQRLASSSQDYYYTASSSNLTQIYQYIASSVTDTRLKRLVISDTLPSNMVLVPGSLQPPAILNDKTLTWNFIPPAGNQITLTYQIQPQQAGYYPANVVAVAGYIQADNVPGQVTFPVPWLTIGQLTSTATSSPTATPSPSETATSTATASPSATPTSTATNLPTQTPSPTMTSTSTPVPSATPSTTPTPTSRATATFTASPTPRTFMAYLPATYLQRDTCGLPAPVPNATIKLPWAGHVVAHIASASSTCKSLLGIWEGSPRLLFPDSQAVGARADIGVYSAGTELLFYLTQRPPCGSETFFSTNLDHAHVSQVCVNRWLIAWEDFDDADFDDSVVEIEMVP